MMKILISLFDRNRKMKVKENTMARKCEDINLNLKLFLIFVVKPVPVVFYGDYPFGFVL